MQRITAEEVLQIVYFTRERGEQPDLSGLDMRGLDLRGLDMRWSNLSGSNLSGCDMQWSNFAGCDLRGSNLTKAIMTGANFSECDMRESNLSECVMIGTDLIGSCMRRSNLTEAFMSWVYLNGCDLRGANLSGSDMRECKGLPRPIKYEDVRVGMIVERRKGDYYVGGRVATIDNYYILTDTKTPLWYAGWSADGDWSLWLMEEAPEDYLQIM